MGALFVLDTLHTNPQSLISCFSLYFDFSRCCLLMRLRAWDAPIIEWRNRLFSLCMFPHTDYPCVTCKSATSRINQSEIRVCGMSRPWRFRFGGSESRNATVVPPILLSQFINSHLSKLSQTKLPCFLKKICLPSDPPCLGVKTQYQSRAKLWMCTECSLAGCMLVHWEIWWKLKLEKGEWTLFTLWRHLVLIFKAPESQ